MSTLLALGFDGPPAVAQTELAAIQSRALGLEGIDLERFRRIVEGSAIESRLVAADVDRTLDLSTAARMRVYAEVAPCFAEGAAREALARAGLAAEAVTDLVVASCTGFSAPGLCVDLVERVRLAHTVRPLQLGFMGCFGGVAALRAAHAIAAGDPEAVVLVVAVELCSLHFRRSTAPDALVSFAIFGDGASAAIVAGDAAVEEARDRGCRPLGRLSQPSTRLLGGRALMGWTIEDDGFRMTLGRAVPGEIERALRDIATARRDDAIASVCAVHPGGVGILDAVDAGVGRPGLCDEARSVLRSTGNTSSGAVLRVLEPVLERARVEASGIAPLTAPVRAGEPSVAFPGLRRGCDIDLLAFGPGLTIDRIRVGVECPSS